MFTACSPLAQPLPSFLGQWDLQSLFKILELFNLFKFTCKCVFFFPFSVATEVSIKSKCKGDVGFKSVYITWASFEQINSSNVTTYRVKYCTSGLPCESTTTGPYNLGCILNATSPQKELQCRIVAKSLFPFQFYYTVEVQTLSGVFISNRKHCRLLTNSKYLATVLQKLYIN